MTGQTGSVGPPGNSVTGPAGPGSTGPTGAAGSNGTAGATGPAGSATNTGATGPQGLAGPTGSAGATGAQGPTGYTGTAGAGTVNMTGTAGAAGLMEIASKYETTGAYFQWGITSNIGNTGHYSLVFPTAFPAACDLVLWMPSGNAGQTPAYLANLSNTGVDMYITGASNGTYLYWFAIGH